MLERIVSWFLTFGVCCLCHCSKFFKFWCSTWKKFLLLLFFKFTDSFLLLLRVLKNREILIQILYSISSSSIWVFLVKSFFSTLLFFFNFWAYWTISFNNNYSFHFTHAHQFMSFQVMSHFFLLLLVSSNVWLKVQHLGLCVIEAGYCISFKNKQVTWD